MNRVRIFKSKDEFIYFDIPADQFQNEENWDKCKVPEWLRQFERIDVEKDKIPQLSPGESSHQYYFDGDMKIENLKIDKDWKICLMSRNIIKQKHLKNLNDKIDKELEKQNSDPIQIAKLQREKEKCQTFSEREWYEQALKNLDERVAGGEEDKPIIRKKLEDKIKELKK